LSVIVLAALGSARAKAVIAAGQTFEGQMYQAYGADAVANWNFDEGSGLVAHDGSGNGNDLNLDPADLGKGAISWASSTDAFRGTSALYISPSSGAIVPAGVTFTTTNPTFDPTNGSISFWIKASQPETSGYGIFCDNNGDGSNFNFCILGSDGTNFIKVLWNGGSGSNQLTTDINFNNILNTWTQVALSWNIPDPTLPGTMRIYINGELEGISANYTYNVDSYSAPYSFCIGGDCSGDNIVSTIDEMRVYSQSLQTGEIEKIYADELPAHLLSPLTYARLLDK